MGAVRGQGGNPYRQYWGKRQADPAASEGAADKPGVLFSDYNNNYRDYMGAVRGQGGNPFKQYWGKRQADPAATEGAADKPGVLFSDYNNNYRDYMGAMRGQGGNPFKQYWGKRQAGDAAGAATDGAAAGDGAAGDLSYGVSLSDYNNNWRNYVGAVRGNNPAGKNPFGQYW